MSVVHVVLTDSKDSVINTIGSFFTAVRLQDKHNFCYTSPFSACHILHFLLYPLQTLSYSFARLCKLLDASPHTFHKSASLCSSPHGLCHTKTARVDGGWSMHNAMRGAHTSARLMALGSSNNTATFPCVPIQDFALTSQRSCTISQISLREPLLAMQLFWKPMLVQHDELPHSPTRHLLILLLLLHLCTRLFYESSSANTALGS